MLVDDDDDDCTVVYVIWLKTSRSKLSENCRVVLV